MTHITVYRDPPEPRTEEVDVDYVWEPTAEDLAADRAMHGDIADAYGVSVRPDVCGGCVIYSRYRGRWQYHPYGVRSLVLHLLLCSGELTVVPEDPAVPRFWTRGVFASRLQDTIQALHRFIRFVAAEDRATAEIEADWASYHLLRATQSWPDDWLPGVVHHDFEHARRVVLRGFRNATSSGEEAGDEND